MNQPFKMRPNLLEWRLISLDRRPERRAAFTKGMPFDESKRILSAVEGSTITDPEGRTDLAGAFGCFASHIALYKEAIFEGRKFLAVFEDDAQPTPLFTNKKKLMFDQAAFLPWDFLHLGRPSQEQREGSIEVIGTEWSIPAGGIVNSHAYNINEDMMQFMVNHFAPEGKEAPYGPPYHFDRAINIALAIGNFGVYYPTRRAMFRQDKSLETDIRW